VMVACGILEVSSYSQLPTTDFGVPHRKGRKAQLPFITRMTQVARIYPYPCVSASSAQSIFYYPPSSFCVHPRQISSRKGKGAAFYYSLIYKVNIIFNQKSDLNDRYFLL